MTSLQENKPEPAAMRWAEVARATVFKRDLFVVDCICLFLARPDGTGLEINEEMARWKTFVGALPQYLPGCRQWPEWFTTVAFPAFATNQTLIYERGESEIAKAALLAFRA